MWTPWVFRPLATKGANRILFVGWTEISYSDRSRWQSETIAGGRFGYCFLMSRQNAGRSNVFPFNCVRDVITVFCPAKRFDLFCFGAAIAAKLVAVVDDDCCWFVGLAGIGGFVVGFLLLLLLDGLSMFWFVCSGVVLFEICCCSLNLSMLPAVPIYFLFKFLL